MDKVKYLVTTNLSSGEICNIKHLNTIDEVKEYLSNAGIKNKKVFEITINQELDASIVLCNKD